jgi:hypothetical protein
VPHQVVTVLSPGANAFEFAVACEVFGLRRPELGPPLYNHELAAVSSPVTVDSGWQVHVDADLAALRTRAREADGGYRVTGQKVWTSFAHASQRCMLLARTSDAAADSRHDGITSVIMLGIAFASQNISTAADAQAIQAGFSR